jgi:hypothetical protein
MSRGGLDATVVVDDDDERHVVRKQSEEYMEARKCTWQIRARIEHLDGPFYKSHVHPSQASSTTTTSESQLEGNNPHIRNYI